MEQNATTDLLVATLDRGVVPSDTPILRADDLGATRGDGVFEAIRLLNGQPWLLAEHLTRLTASATLIELTLPPPQTLGDLITTACEAWHGDPDAIARLVCTRGPESGGGPTIYATVQPVPDHRRRARHDGLSVRTATLGVTLDVRRSAPWLLTGAKTLSYGVNLATQRWAAANGADDALWTSAEGHALEGPTSSLMWLERGTLYTTPAEQTGVLHGTVAAWLLAHASELGWRSGTRLIRPEGLLEADGVWLVSSAVGAAAVHTLDGTTLRDNPHTPRILKLLGYAL